MGRLVDVPTEGAGLEGLLALPPEPSGIVVFAHGSGSGRHSPRNQAVAEVLVQGGLGTLLIDLLTADEEAQELAGGRLRFDVDLLGERVIAAIDWLATEAVVGDLPPGLRHLPVGTYGASTGAAAALIACTGWCRGAGAPTSPAPCSEGSARPRC